MEKIVLVDFAGTLIKTEIIDEANKFRSEILKRALPTKEEHANPEQLYKTNRELVEKLTGLKTNMKIKYRTNDLRFLEINGEDYQNQIATNLFQIGMYQVANKHKQNIFPKGLIDQLKRIKKLGYKLGIVSGVRQDIISGMLQIAEIPLGFDYIYGQPPILGVSNEDNMKLLKKHGKIEFVLGDKLSDLEPAKLLKAKSIFVTWGHPSGGEEEFADYVIKDPKELEKIIHF